MAKSPVQGWRRILEILGKLRMDYRIIVRSEGDLDAKYSILLKPMNWFILISTFLVLGWVVVGGLLLYTPLGYYFPGFHNRSWQDQVIEQTRRLDSLQHQLELHEVRMAILRRELLGEDSVLYQNLPRRELGVKYGVEWLDSSLGDADSLLKLEVEKEFSKLRQKK